jgi:excisionase family DNA binding protein
MTPAIEPIALSPREAARFLSLSKRTLSNLIRSKKITARKLGVRTLVDLASLKAYYESLALKTDHAPLVFGERAHVRPKAKRKTRH